MPHAGRGVDRAFRNGRPNETDTVWQARGTLLREGTPIGAIRGEVRNGEIRAVLRLGEEDVVLESFQL